MNPHSSFCSSYSIAEYILFVFLFRPPPVLFHQTPFPEVQRLKKKHRRQAILDHTIRIKSTRPRTGEPNSFDPRSLRIH